MSTRAGPSVALLDELREKIVPVLRPYALRVELFGSFARGEQRPDSDIDLLIRLRPSEQRPPLGLRWFGLEREMSELLGHPVEMTTEDALSRHVRPYIQPDRIVLYEE
jgi:predicted nucleotidyltransferase